MITVYSKPNCSMCEATKATLDKYELEYTLIDFMADPAALDKVISMGYQQAPVVVVEQDGIESSWSGYEPIKIAQYAMGTR